MKYIKMVSHNLKNLFRSQEQLRQHEALLRFHHHGDPADYDQVIETLSEHSQILDAIIDEIQESRREDHWGLMAPFQSRLELLDLAHQFDELNHLVYQFRNICLESSDRRATLQSKIIRKYNEISELSDRLQEANHPVRAPIGKSHNSGKRSFLYKVP